MARREPPDFAHEINQPLNVIRMAAETALDRLRSGRVDGPYLESRLTVIVEQTLRAADLVRELREDLGRSGRE